MRIFIPFTIFDRFWIGLVVGLPLVFVGALFIILAVRTLQKEHVDPRFKPVGTIVDQGLFGYTRNPMYLAFTLIYSGISLSVNSFWPFALLPFLLGIMHYGVIRREERYLEELFGDEYRAYRRRVHRWL